VFTFTFTFIRHLGKTHNHRPKDSGYVSSAVTQESFECIALTARPRCQQTAMYRISVLPAGRARAGRRMR
jgi:hypothetical protein